MIKVKGIICSQCGSNDITIIDDNHAICNSCNSNLKIEDNTERHSTIVVKHVDENTKAKSPAVGFFKIKENLTLKDFTRSAYVDLFTSNVTDDVCNAKFLPARVEQKNYVLVNSEYDINYSASLGFNKTEKYIGTEKKRGSNGYYEVLVEKERVVTEWRPTSGVYKGSNNAVCEIGKEPSFYYMEEESNQNWFNEGVLKNAQESFESIDTSEKTKEPFTLAQVDIKRTCDWGAKMLSRKCGDTLSCDKLKGFSYTYKEKPRAIMGIVSNELVLPYKIGNGNYSVKSFSNKLCTNIDGIMTHDKDRDFKKEKRSFILPPLTLFIILFLATFISTIVATNVLIYSLITSGLVSFFGSIFFALFIWSPIHNNAWHNITKKQSLINSHQRDTKKYKALVKILKDMNFAPLSKEEESKFKFLDQREIKMKPVEKLILFLSKKPTQEKK